MPSLSAVRASNQAWRPAYRPVVVVAGGTNGSLIFNHASNSLQVSEQELPLPSQSTLLKMRMHLILLSSAAVNRERTTSSKK
jgi:hypothetical protein